MEKKLEVDLQKSPGFRKMLLDFCNAKKTVYDYSKEEFDKKTENFFNNIEKITFAPSKSPLKINVGLYKASKKELILRFEPNEEEFSSEEMQVIIHELNHAWNYEKNKRMGILPKKFGEVKKKLNNPFDFKLFDEVLNEAETQMLCSTELKEKSKDFNPKENQFHGYSKHESIFETLCIICNQNGREFLKDIEGKDIFGIISHISNQMKIPEDEVNDKTQRIANLITKMNSNISKYELKSVRNMMRSLRENTEIEMLNVADYVKEGQEIYEILRETIEQSGYDDDEKKKVLLKFETAQDKIGYRLLGDEKLRKAINNS